jgi:hypothetical protein
MWVFSWVFFSERGGEGAAHARRRRGYRREYGNKGAYKTQYANGYHAGYQAACGNRY